MIQHLHVVDSSLGMARTGSCALAASNHQLTEEGPAFPQAHGGKTQGPAVISHAVVTSHSHSLWPQPSTCSFLPICYCTGKKAFASNISYPSVTHLCNQKAGLLPKEKSHRFLWVSQGLWTKYSSTMENGEGETSSLTGPVRGSVSWGRMLSDTHDMSRCILKDNCAAKRLWAQVWKEEGQEKGHPNTPDAVYQ